MPEEPEYLLYRHRDNGNFISVKYSRHEVELFPESGYYARRKRTVMASDAAGRLLSNYVFTGVRISRNDVLSPGSFFTRPVGGFFLSISSDHINDSCTGLSAANEEIGIPTVRTQELLEQLANGELITTAPDPAGTESLEFGRYYGVGEFFFTVFSCRKDADMVCIQPENGWMESAVDVNAAAFSRALADGWIKPVEGTLFTIPGPQQLPKILTKYKTFEDLETGRVYEVRVISKSERRVETTSGSLGYDELMTGICARRLVPHLGIRF